uniref:Cytochrome b6/f complex subunit VI n=1 Tax=Astrosyne radiata TaxID=1158023 RepID=A0A2U9NT08_9STRA|nr:cytochrome b6/f complex subunit VI [Astrosyne radiata]AWT40270.1 cytochrome b6/f complex subunit VI [Astrosyne radiata]
MLILNTFFNYFQLYIFLVGFAFTLTSGLFFLLKSFELL